MTYGEDKFFLNWERRFKDLVAQQEHWKEINVKGLLVSAPFPGQQSACLTPVSDCLY